jgi:hypothetical protein
MGSTRSAWLLVASASLLVMCDATTQTTNLTSALPPEASDAGADIEAAVVTDVSQPLDADGGDAGVADAVAETTEDRADAIDASAALFYLRLEAGAFPPVADHPSAIVYLPAGYRATPPLAVVVFLHGYGDCAATVVQAIDTACSTDAAVRPAFGLAAQLESTGKNAMLLVPELSFDLPTSDPGSLGSAGGFSALLSEVLGQLVVPLGHATLADVGAVILVSHGGGYLAASGIAAKGGVAVTELHLLDSLLGSTAGFDTWVQADLASLAGAPPARRFSDFYTVAGGTLPNSQAMAGRAAAWVAADAGMLVDDRTTADWSDAMYEHGLLFKLSALSHDDLARQLFGKIIRTSSLPAR